MKKSVLLVLVGKRDESAIKVQQLLTGWGCIIKTRLGLHDDVLEDCSNKGLLILELVGTDDQNNELSRKLSVLPGVISKLVDLELEE
ncbi:MAG: hypothetical protein JW995_10485 [Melioribacteraceae bacterium]|nr:hypothetical protein [Melioribacteraceae bacterium]